MNAKNILNNYYLTEIILHHNTQTIQSLIKRFVAIRFMNHRLTCLQNFKLIIIKKPLHKLNNRYNLYSYISSYMIQKK